MSSKKQLTSFLAASTLLFGLLTAPFAFAAGKEKVLYSFTGGTDGGYPLAGLIFDAAGNLYGTTDIGGANNVGTVFELTHAKNGTWAETVLYSFQNNGQDGFYPEASLIFDAAGNLYGTTLFGGANNVGTVFELLPGSNGTWTETILHSFQKNAQDGSYPYADLIFDATGNLYGTTFAGGAVRSGCNAGCGTVFELTPGSGNTWTEKVLHFFNYRNGAYPYAGPILDAAGRLYGTTSRGNRGNVFQLKSSANGKWTEKVLHSFNGDQQGAGPVAPVIFDAAGNLYGTALDSSGHDAGGTVFKLTHGTWTEKLLHTFQNNGQDGINPRAGVIFDKKGNLYGTTANGGASGTACYGNGCGTVFKLKHGTWTETVLYSFTGGSDGGFPEAGVISDAAGNLYGTTNIGGGSGCGGGAGCGVVYEITP